MFQITQSAAEQIKNSLTQTNAEGLALRIAAKSNKDGSIEYGMGFDDVKEEDLHFDQKDIVIVTDPASKELLEEATMDFVEIEPGDSQFIFLNPLDPYYVPPKKNG